MWVLTSVCVKIDFLVEDEETNLHDMSIVSDEGLDVSQRFVENLFVGSDLDADSEEIITGTRPKLLKRLRYFSLS